MLPGLVHENRVNCNLGYCNLSYVVALFVASHAFYAQKPCARRHNLERVMGIEPTQSAWKAEVLPLNYTRKPVSKTNKKQNGGGGRI